MSVIDEDKEKEELRRLVLLELESAGWEVNHKIINPPPAGDKQMMRRLHRTQRIERAKRERWVVEKYGSSLINEFAVGKEIVPNEFSPILIQVESGSWESYVFRFATLLWSIPVSRGYGRRMRYLIKDESNGKLVGIFALGDPVFNLKKRDDHIGWNSNQRKERLYHVMDAYVLGAVPPYNELLGGKFVALSTLSDEVRSDFRNKYRGRQTIIEGKKKEASLVLITTTSALGRSSIYNRLKFENGTSAFQSVGYSRGWGHFHISNSTFELLRDWLRSLDEKYADGYAFGQGPNWKMRTIRRAFELLGFDMDLLRHGLQREIFLAPLAKNYRDYLTGTHNRPRYYKNRRLSEINSFFKERWMIPRAGRVDRWIEWTHHNTWERIVKNCNWHDQYRMF